MLEREPWVKLKKTGRYRTGRRAFKTAKDINDCHADNRTVAPSLNHLIRVYFEIQYEFSSPINFPFKQRPRTSISAVRRYIIRKHVTNTES